MTSTHKNMQISIRAAANPEDWRRPPTDRDEFSGPDASDELIRSGEMFTSSKRRVS